MVKKKLKYSIAVIGILIFIITVCYLCISKSTVLTNAINKGKTILAPNQAEADDGSITYNTAGNDSANYIDGDTSGEKSAWVKNGDIWTYTFYVDDPNAQWYVYEDSSTLMEGYSGDHTEYNAGSLFTEETLDSFTPADNMTATTNSDGNNVYTWLDSENSYKVTDNGDGTFTKVTTKLSLTVTNYQLSEDQTAPEEAIRYGDLIINKVVKNSEGTVLNESEDSTNFTFTITLTTDDSHKALVEGTKIYGDVVFKNGVGTVALKAGGSVTISGIPEGLSYSVKERTAVGYDTTCETTYYGVIDEDTPSVVTYVNTKKASSTPGTSGGSEEKFTSFTVAKKVTGNAEVDEEYAIEIVLDNLKPETTYTLSNGTTFTSDSVGSANVSVSLKNNESITVQNIPVGAKYKAYESAGNYISSYVITDANNAGLINNTAKNNTKENKDIATNTETADEGEDITITFTNKRIVTQNLKVQKEVTDSTDANNYIFEIEFANMEPESSFNSTVGKITADENERAELTIYLAGGENAEFYNVPVGTTYTVKELASASIASYRIVDENGTNQIVSDSNANAVSKKALSTELETVNQGEEVTVTFINDTVNQEPDSVSASLGVTKNVVDEDGSSVENCKDTFTFELTSEDENTPMPEKQSVTVTGNGTASFGTITFRETGTYTYKIVEKAGDANKYDYDEAVYTIVYEVTNPEGLLEITKVVKKNGFDGDVVEFTNVAKIVDEPVEPGDSEEPKEDEKEEPENVGEEENVEKQESASPQTGDKVIGIISLLVVAGVVLVITLRRRG